MKKLLGILTVLLALSPAGCSAPPADNHAPQATQPSVAEPETPPTTERTATARPQRPIPGIQRVLIISVDGLRPDLAIRADTPNIHRLLNEASFTLWARTTAVAVTLPSHTSMLTGCVPNKHGIEWNSDLPFKKPVYPNVPTIFARAHRAGYSTAMAAGKTKFATLNKPRTIDWVFIPKKEPIDDADVAAHAVSIILAHQPQVMFVHLPDVDNVGHKYGWGSPEQLAAIAHADRAIGSVLTAERAEHVLDKTLVIVTADHGGAGLSHGPDDPRSRSIPWIAAGPGVRRNFDLTRIGPLDVQTYDTYVTACFVLGINPGRYVDGRVVKEIFSQIELLEPLVAPKGYDKTMVPPDATEPAATEPTTESAEEPATSEPATQPAVP